MELAAKKASDIIIEGLILLCVLKSAAVPDLSPCTHRAAVHKTFASYHVSKL